MYRFYLIIRLAIVVFLFFATGLIAGSPASLLSVRKYVDATDICYEFVCSGDVRHASTFSEAPLQIVLYFRDVQLPPDIDGLLTGDLRGIIDLKTWMQDPPVVRAVISLPEKLAYRVDNIDGTVKVFVDRPVKNGTIPSTVPAIKPKSNLLEKLSSGERISADFHGADIGNVLRVLARQNGLNIVASDSVKGKITVTLKNVTVEQALEGILRANGYKYIIENGVVLVKPSQYFNFSEMETRVFRLQYIDAHNLLDAIGEMKSAEGKIKVLTSSFHNRKDVYDVNDRLQPDRELRYWLRSSVLLVTDFPANLETISKLVAQLDVPVPQVMIEAKLIEASPRDGSNIGIDWSKSLTAELFNEVVLDGAAVYRYSAQTPLPNKNQNITLGTLSTSQFNAVINFLKTKTNTRLVSNPRIMAMDNEPSDISVGTNFPVPQINRGVGGQGDIVTFMYKDVNITLRVIPHVTGSNTITMYVNPIIEEITGQVTVDKNSAPITSRREVDTVVKVKDGETIVIGGMIKEREAVVIDKVWLLGNIPLLGHLFRNKTSEKQQTDLLIFITPKIVMDSE